MRWTLGLLLAFLFAVTGIGTDNYSTWLALSQFERQLVEANSIYRFQIEMIGLVPTALFNTVLGFLLCLFIAYVDFKRCWTKIVFLTILGSFRWLAALSNLAIVVTLQGG